MPEEQPNGADVAVEIAGQKVNLRNVKSLNTLATVAILILMGPLLYMGYVHSTDAKDSGREIAKELKEANREIAATLKESNKELGHILKELSQAAREQNCLLTMPPEKRAENAEICKRISR